MRLPNSLLFLLFSIAVCQVSIGQEENTITADQALKTSTIKEQFEVVIKKSGRYQEYKVVKQVWINKLKTNTLDSIKTIEAKLKTSNTEIAEQKNTIDGLQESLTKTNEELASVTDEKESISFFGVNMSKSSYKTVMWVIVGVLLGLLSFFIFKFRNSNTATVQAKKALAETEAEFEEHRRRALEREQKVMRKLQDEINKQRKAGAK